MAIDTENKRRSVAHILPVPDSDIDQADRQQVAWIYSGILVIQLLGEVLSRIYEVPTEDRIYEVPAENRIYDVPTEDRIYEVMMTTETHFTKDPAGIIDYTVRWRTWLPSGDTISASSWILPAGITKVSEANNTIDAVIFLASGTLGQIYLVTNRVVTFGGRQNDQTISILIEDK